MVPTLFPVMRCPNCGFPIDLRSHPDFTSDLATITWIDHKEEEKRLVAIQCGRHQLVSKPLIGNYPNHKQVIPSSANELAVIPHDRKPGLIAWPSWKTVRMW